MITSYKILMEEKSILKISFREFMIETTSGRFYRYSKESYLIKMMR